MDVIRSVKRPFKDVDYGFVGDVKSVNGKILSELIMHGIIPVMAPLTHDGHGNMLNTNSDTIAAEVAKTLAEYFDVTLTYCFEKKGVLRDEHDDDSVIPVITSDNYDKLKTEGVISGGMLPKLENAFSAIRVGVVSVVITSFQDICGSHATIIRK
jgi:acetylglutamate kinase